MIKTVSNGPCNTGPAGRRDQSRLLNKKNVDTDDFIDESDYI